MLPASAPTWHFPSILSASAARGSAGEALCVHHRRDQQRQPEQTLGRADDAHRAGEALEAAPIALADLEDADERFYIPENLHLIGIMNTAHFSLAMVDDA